MGSELRLRWVEKTSEKIGDHPFLRSLASRGGKGQNIIVFT